MAIAGEIIYDETPLQRMVPQGNIIDIDIGLKLTMTFDHIAVPHFIFGRTNWYQVLFRLIACTMQKTILLGLGVQWFLIWSDWFHKVYYFDLIILSHFIFHFIYFLRTWLVLYFCYLPIPQKRRKTSDSVSIYHMNQIFKRKADWLHQSRPWQEASFQPGIYAIISLA